MGKSLWNRGASIPIEALSESERKEAIHEWSEGNYHLENLLLQCYQKGIVTGGCDAGDHHSAYVDFYVEDSSKEAVRRILLATQNHGNVGAFLLMGGNPYSGPNWYKPVISLSPIKSKEAESFFDMLSSSLEEGKESFNDEVFTNILDFYEFFKEKIAGIHVRILETENDGYRLSMECYGDKCHWEYLSELFKKAGMKKDEKLSQNAPCMIWELKCSDKATFNLEAKRVLEVLNDGWCLEIPEEVTEDMGFNQQALIMRRRFGSDANGVKRMNDWLNAKRKPGRREVNY